MITATQKWLLESNYNEHGNLSPTSTEIAIYQTDADVVGLDIGMLDDLGECWAGAVAFFNHEQLATVIEVLIRALGKGLKS